MTGDEAELAACDLPGWKLNSCEDCEMGYWADGEVPALMGSVGDEQRCAIPVHLALCSVGAGLVVTLWIRAISFDLCSVWTTLTLTRCRHGKIFD